MPNHNGGETLTLLEQIMKKYSINIPFVLYTGVNPEKICLPHTEKFHLLDFWNKENSIDWQKKVKYIVKRMRRQDLWNY